MDVFFAQHFTKTKVCGNRITLNARIRQQKIIVQSTKTAKIKIQSATKTTFWQKYVHDKHLARKKTDGYLDAWRADAREMSQPEKLSFRLRSNERMTIMNVCNNKQKQERNARYFWLNEMSCRVCRKIQWAKNQQFIRNQKKKKKLHLNLDQLIAYSIYIGRWFCPLFFSTSPFARPPGMRQKLCHCSLWYVRRSE